MLNNKKLYLSHRPAIYTHSYSSAVRYQWHLVRLQTFAGSTLLPLLCEASDRYQRYADCARPNTQPDMAARYPYLLGRFAIKYPVSRPATAHERKTSPAKSFGNDFRRFARDLSDTRLLFGDTSIYR